MIGSIVAFLYGYVEKTKGEQEQFERHLKMLPSDADRQKAIDAREEQARQKWYARQRELAR